MKIKRQFQQIFDTKYKNYYITTLCFFQYYNNQPDNEVLLHTTHVYFQICNITLEHTAPPVNSPAGTDAVRYSSRFPVRVEYLPDQLQSDISISEQNPRTERTPDQLDLSRFQVFPVRDLTL